MASRWLDQLLARAGGLEEAVRVAAGAGVGRRGQGFLALGVVQRIVELGDRDGGVAEGRVLGDILDALAVDIDLAAVAQRLEVLGARERALLALDEQLGSFWHGSPSGCTACGLAAIIARARQDRSRNDHREPGVGHRCRRRGLRPHGRPARARDPAGAGAASARLHPRGAADRAGVPGGDAADRGHRPAHHGLAQRGRADGGLARRLRARLPPQQRRQRADRDAGQSARAVLARGPAAVRERRHAWCARRRRGRRWSSTCRSLDGEGGRSQGAEVDVWHSSPEGLYENQDPPRPR